MNTAAIMSKWDNDEVVQRLRDYLKIPSVHPDIDYSDCVEFIKKQAEQLHLPVVVHEFVPKKPIVVLTWEGLNPELPSILLNSHMDVVPVYEEHWTYPPFEAHISEDDFIFARGVQDMKSVGMIYLEAVRRFKDAGIRLKRTVHITFVPDEEIGGIDGMKVFSESNEFRELNIGFGLDESGPSNTPNVLYAFHGERTSRQIKVTCRAPPGHGAFSTTGTAGEKLHYIINKFMTLRAQEMAKIENGNGWSGDIISINLTQVEGGVQVNVLPENLSVTFDIRIPPDVDHDEFENMIERWCKEAGKDVTFEYITKNPKVKSTKLDDSVPFWGALCKATEAMGLKVTPSICPGGTDAKFVRRQGIPVINLTPITNTPILLHAHDEKLHIDQFKNGIDIMEKILEAIANV